MPPTGNPSREACRAAERRLRALEEGAVGHGIATIDAGGRIVGWSAGARAILGWSEAEVLGRDAGMLFLAEDRAAGLPERDLAEMRARDRTSRTGWLMRRDGGRCRAACEMIALRGDDGAFEGYLKLVYDRSPAVGRRFAPFPVASPGIGFWEWDGAAGLVLADEGVALLCGLDPRRLAAGVAATALLDLVHPDDRPRVREEIGRAAATGRDFLSEHRILHRDGSMRHVVVRGSGGLDDAGRSRLSGVFVDVTGQRRSEDLRLVADALPILIGYVDSRQRYRFNNRYYEGWFGRTSGEIMGMHVRDLLGEEAYAVRRQAIEAALEGRHVVFDAFMPHRDGGRRETEMQYVPRRNADGVVEGFFVIAFDVTARKRSEEHLRLLNDELNHRAKNLLAMVQSIAWQTLGDADSLPQARDAFTARLMVLGKAHDLLTMRNREGASLAEVVSLTVQAHQGATRRFRVSGPDIRLPPKAALSISMALHELATNAVKYGALSNGTGQVAIGWRILDGIEGRHLCLCWRESGGPPVTTPMRRGFGSRLIERGLAAELGGTVTMDYDRSGVVCTIEAPLARD